MAERTLIRLGAGSAVVGAVIFAIANLLHPRSENIDVAIEQVRAVAQDDTYIFGHVLLLIGPLLMLWGLVALRRSIKTERGSAFALYGFVTALVSAGHLAALVGIDGRPTKVIADTYVTASGADARTLELIAETVEEVNFGTLSVWIILFFGITYILYGLAVAASDDHPKWLGWAAVAMGTVQFVTGVVVTLNGPSELMITRIFSPVAFLETIWLLAMGALMWIKAPQVSRSSVA
jgi:hypothetical protein